MRTIAISGNFLRFRNPIGVQRVAFEIVRHLDRIVERTDEIELIIPENALKDISLQNIKKVILPSNVHKMFWNHTYFARYVKEKDRVPLIIDAEGLFTVPTYFYLYDLNYAEHPEHFNGCKRKLIRRIRLLFYFLAVHNAKRIITTSEFQKKRIEKYYKFPQENIDLTYLGWEHMQLIDRDENVFMENPQIKKKNYFLSVGTVIKYKNFQWTLNFAKNNPQYQFVFVGNIFKNDFSSYENLNALENIIFLGYVSDEKMKALMSECKAFIYPSLYEGFGLPPLEAIACGADAIVSTATCLPEIYRNNVYYIDPYNRNMTIKEIYQQKPAPAEELLSIYSWEDTARNLYQIIKEGENQDG